MGMRRGRHWLTYLGIVLVGSFLGCGQTEETTGGGPGSSGKATDYTQGSDVLTADVDADSGPARSFEDDIQPYLEQYCLRCHESTRPRVAKYDDVRENYKRFFKGEKLSDVPRHHKVKKLSIEGLEGPEDEYPDEWEEREEFYKDWKAWISQGAPE